MKTLFALSLNRLGLTQSEAAKLGDWRIDTVKSWSSGRNATPDFVWPILRDYEALIVDRSECLREIWEEKGEPGRFDVECETHIEQMAHVDFLLSPDAPSPL